MLAAPSVVLRSDSLSALSISSCKIDRLVLASGGGDILLAPDAASDIRTAVAGTGGGKITFRTIPNIEITGSNRDVILTGTVRNLHVSGSGNRITIGPGVVVDTLKILGAGSDNTITNNGFVGECTIYGPGTVMDGTGTVRKLQDNAKNSSVSAKATDTYVNKDYGLNSVVLAMTAPDNVSSYTIC
jgi:hypothetical protein